MKKLSIIIIIIVFIAGAGWLLMNQLPVSLWSTPPGSGVTTISPADIRVETVLDNSRAPWSIDITDNGDIFFTERGGLVRVLRPGQAEPETIRELPDSDTAEGGTLGLVLDPNFSTNHYIYIYYTTGQPQNRISRFRFNGQQLVEEKILIDNIPGAEFHNGGRIAFGPDGKLYAGTGDGRQPELAQDNSSLAGKILRIASNGDIPVDNPDPDSYVYSIGHRNVQGLAWDQDNKLYATEHGPRARDEINRIKPGANYGWPRVKGHLELGSGDAPVADYRNPVRSSGSVTWAPSGAAFYTGNSLPSQWQDTFLLAGLRSQSLWRYDSGSDQLQRLMHEEYGRLRDVHQGPDGNLYILTSNRDGRGNPVKNDDRILRIEPAD
jgi:glucose/arabinose dehydrogenase